MTAPIPLPERSPCRVLRHCRVGVLAASLALGSMPAAATVDLATLWNFGDPAASEQRFRAALASADGDDALILQTQIARAHGLRRDFGGARAILAAIEPQLRGAGAEARVRHLLERGRTWVSATHPPASLSPDARSSARSNYQRALGIARAARLDALAVDALHMMAFVDTAPADQLKWGREALAIAEASDQPAAQAWQASLHNNLGVALHELGRYDEALAAFRRALVLRELRGEAGPARTARWMVGWTLRALHRDDEALALQLQLEREGDAAGAPDPYVFEELEILYRLRGERERALHYAQRRQAASR